ncbi:hypothetical protein MUB42_07170 (plasmid) [Apilactobacillus kunkeei]|nr:hypothetical protein MUB42_07170 [Apilactobacillus kunkeei]
MKKYIDMADYWTVDKILDYVETYYQLVEKEKKLPVVGSFKDGWIWSTLKKVSRCN